MSRPSDEGSLARREEPRTIAVLVDWLKDGYQNLVFAGMADAARDAGVNLACLAGGILGSPSRCGAPRNVIYNLASPETVDGILLMSGTLGNHVGPVELGRFCERFAPSPIVSISVAIPGIPALIIDDAEGMRSAVRHLVAVHGHRRIAFVRGPEVNEEAQRRFVAYQEVLSEAGLPFDERLVAPGNFQHEAGVAAMRLLLDERRVSFDAVVAVNDHMILGVVDELTRRGMRVPGQVAVVGFDDIDQARFGTPPLTTVRQPLYEQGVRALELLLHLANGGACDATTRMKSDLVLRESCGCGRFRPRTDEQSRLSSPGLGAPQRQISRDDTEGRQLMRRPLGGSAAALPRGWELQLTNAWHEDIEQSLVESSFAGRFRETLRQLVDRVVAAGGDVGSWQHVISAMRAILLPALTEPRRSTLGETLLHEAREEVACRSEADQARQRFRVDHWTRVLSETSEALLSSSDLPSLLRVLEDRLPHFGIPSGYMYLYDGDLEVPASAKLFLAYDRTGLTKANARPSSIPLWGMIADTIGPRDRNWTVIVEPLFAANQQLGFAIFEVGPREGIIYESLREQISSAIHGVRLVEQVVQEAADRLHGQKLEAIGTLASGIAHELNTPIQYVGDSVTFLTEAVQSYQRVLDGYRSLLGENAEARGLEEAEDVSYFIEEVPRASARSLAGLGRAATIITAMKDFARKDARQQALSDINRGLMNTLEVARSEYRDCADIELRLGDIPLVRCYMGDVNQVFLSLIVNAAHAVQDVVNRTGQRGTVTTRSLLVGNDVIVEIEDTGGGIPVGIQDKIFEPFFTTKGVGKGTGQGLAIARSSIVDKHGGTLTFTTEVGVGSVFRVSLPVAGKTPNV